MRIQNQASASALLSRSLPGASLRRKGAIAFAEIAGKWSVLFLLCLLISALSALGQAPPSRPPSAPPPPDDPGDLGPGYPRLDQPWRKGDTKQKKTKAAPKPAPAPKPVPVAP